MSNRAQLAAVMPAMLLHEGHWDGWYRHYEANGLLADEHRVKTWCEFPDAGAWHYIQHNELVWEDGRNASYEFGGRLVDDRLVWNTDRFSGYGWQTHENVLMLRLERRDVANAYYIEMIAIAADGRTRARTWEWFKDGRPWKWTLCNEEKVG